MKDKSALPIIGFGRNIFIPLLVLVGFSLFLAYPVESAHVTPSSSTGGSAGKVTAGGAPIPATPGSFVTAVRSSPYTSASTFPSPGGTITAVFPAGNISVSGGRSAGFAAMVGGTASYRNADGTYNTVTAPTWSSCSGGNCGGGDSTPTCPSGTQYNNGQCVPVTCTTTGSGKGAQSTCVPTDPLTPSCPAGQAYSASGCVPTQICTTSGSGKGASTSCVPNPVLSNPPASCFLDGVTVPHGQSRVFFSQPSVPYGQTCASVAAARMCSNGNLSGSSVYNRANCSVGNAPTLGTITIDAAPQIIRYGSSSRISWDGGNAEACVVTGTNFTGSGVKGSQLATNINGETVYTLSCVLGPYQKSVSTTVRIVPVWQEI